MTTVETHTESNGITSEPKRRARKSMAPASGVVANMIAAKQAEADARKAGLSRIAELQEEIAEIKAVLGDPGTPGGMLAARSVSPRSALFEAVPKPAHKPRKPRAAKAAAAGELDEAVLAFLSTSATPVSAGSIAKAVYGDTKAVSLALRNLRASGSVTSSGEKRGTVWSVVGK